jgi:hypothetical protein
MTNGIKFSGILYKNQILEIVEGEHLTITKKEEVLGTTISFSRLGDGECSWKRHSKSGAEISGISILGVVVTVGFAWF